MTGCLEPIFTKKNGYRRLYPAPESGTAYTGPSLFLCGRQDSVTGDADQYELLPHYPRASYAVLDRAGHNLQIEQPALLAVLIDDWLARIASGPTSR